MEQIIKRVEELTKIDIAKQFVGSKANHDKEWEIAKKSITLVKNDNNMLPIKENEKTVVMVPYANEVTSAEYAIERLKDEGIIDENMDVTADQAFKWLIDDIKYLKGDSETKRLQFFKTEEVPQNLMDADLINAYLNYLRK